MAPLQNDLPGSWSSASDSVGHYLRAAVRRTKLQTARWQGSQCASACTHPAAWRVRMLVVRNSCGGLHRPLKTTLSTVKLQWTSYKHAPGAERALVAVRIVQLLAGAAVEAEQSAAALSGQQLARRAAVSLPHGGVLTKIQNSALQNCKNVFVK